MPQKKTATHFSAALLLIRGDEVAAALAADPPVVWDLQGQRPFLGRRCLRHPIQFAIVSS